MTRPAGDPAGTDPLGPSWLGEPWPQRPRRRRGPWVLLLCLVLVGLVLWGFARCGAALESPDAAGSATQAGVNPDAGNPNVNPGRPAPAGTLTTTGGASLLPLVGSAGPNGELTPFAGEEVAGSSMQVLSMLSGGGFWAGNNNTDRVWVELVPAPPEPPTAVRPGDLVDLTGRIVAHGPDFAAQHGVDAAMGADQLTLQAAHVEVTPDRVQPVGIP